MSTVQFERIQLTLKEVMFKKPKGDTFLRYCIIVIYIYNIQSVWKLMISFFAQGQIN